MKPRFPRKGWLIILLIFGILAGAYLSSFIFHKGIELKLLDYINPNPSDPLVTWETAICTERFCSVTCPNSYFAFSGRCSSSAGWQWNLNGASSNFKSWYCFDSSLINWAQTNAPPFITADAMCIKVGNTAIANSPPELGNYVVEGTEVCDLNNTGNLDCTDFTYFNPESGTNVQLCNGYLTCNATGTGYDTSHCEYCVQGNCPAGQTYCKDDICHDDCTNFGGAFSSGVVIGGPSVPGCPDGIVNNYEECDDGNYKNGDGCSALCRDESIPPVCGNRVVEPLNLEQCDPPFSTAPSGVTFRCAGPPPYCVEGKVVCDSQCKWKEMRPFCGDGLPAPDPQNWKGGGGGTCNTTGDPTYPSDV